MFCQRGEWSRRQGCIKLQREGSPGRGGDSLSLQFQADSAGTSCPRPGKRSLMQPYRGARAGDVTCEVGQGSL